MLVSEATEYFETLGGGGGVAHLPLSHTHTAY